MSYTYEAYEVVAVNREMIGEYATLAEAHDAAQSDADADERWDLPYEIRGYDGSLWSHVEDFNPVDPRQGV